MAIFVNVKRIKKFGDLLPHQTNVKLMTAVNDMLTNHSHATATKKIYWKKNPIDVRDEEYNLILKPCDPEIGINVLDYDSYKLNIVSLCSTIGLQVDWDELIHLCCGCLNMFVSEFEERQKNILEEKLVRIIRSDFRAE